MNTKMKNAKELFAFGAFALLLILVSSCGGNRSSSSSSASASSSGSDNAAKVGFSISTLNNPFFVSMADGARARAAELGVNLSIVDARNDTAKQISDIEDLISSGISVLIVNPEDSASVGPVVNDAKNAGIKVIAVDRYVEGAEVDCYIGTDNVIAGEQAGNYLVEKLSSGDKIAILEGIPGASSAIDRNQGFRNAVDGKLDVVTSQTANFNRAESLTVTENILQANPDIKAILSANDEMGLGAIEAVESAGKVPGVDILVTGFDANDDAVIAVQEGKMLFTVEQKTTEMGQMAVESAFKMINGETVEKLIPIDITLLDIDAINAAN